MKGADVTNSEARKRLTDAVDANFARIQEPPGDPVVTNGQCEAKKDCTLEATATGSCRRCEAGNTVSPCATDGCTNWTGGLNCVDCIDRMVLAEPTASDIDMVNEPKHYNSHPKGIEAIDVIEDCPYANIAQVLRYAWRVSWGSKWDDLEDLRKARWYIQREIARREQTEPQTH